MAKTINETVNADILTVTERDITVNAGVGADKIVFSNGSRNVIHGNMGNDTVTMKIDAGTVYKIYSDADNDTPYRQADGDVIAGSADNNTFVYCRRYGNETITDYTAGKDMINPDNSSISQAKISSNEAPLLLSDDGTITANNTTGQAIDYVDSFGIRHSITPAITQQDIIKKFMKSLDDTVKTSALTALNNAVNYASEGFFPTWNALINSFVSDVKYHGGTADDGKGYIWVNGQITVEESTDTFLKTYCGIDLTNEDTGSITGADAGGTEVKTPTSVVQEAGTIRDLQSSPSTNSMTVNGLTFSWEPTNEANEKAVLDRLYTWWAKGGLNLVEESYGLSFTEEGTSVNNINVEFYTDETSSILAFVEAYHWASGPNSGVSYSLTLNVNMSKFATLDLTDVSGYAGSNRYLDRTLAHEFTHAAMEANITDYSSLPYCLREGLAELTHGIDDVRFPTICSLAQSINSTILQTALTSEVIDSYTGGYMLFRYFAKQVAENCGTFVEKLYGTNGADYLYGGDGDDFLYGQGGDDFLYGQGGNDYLHGGAGSDTFVYSNGDGSDTVADYTAGDDTIRLSSGSISKTELADNGTDIKFTVGSGSITVQNGAGKVISLEDSRGSYTVSGTRIALGKDFKGEMDAGKYLFTVTNIAGSGAVAAVTLRGNANNNIMSGGVQADTLYGGDGADTLYGGSGADKVYGEAGNDLLDGYTGNDTLTGGTGNDTLSGGAGSDTFLYSNGDGSDTVTDYAVGDDTIKIASGSINKTELADNGTDVKFTVGSGSITVQNGKGKVISLEDSRGSYMVSDTRIAVGKDFKGEMDAGKYLSTVTNIAGSGAAAGVTLRGNVNDNVMSGGAQADMLFGGDGADTLYGYGGNDVLYGQQGNDTLTGGTGNDTLSGGAGSDTFLYFNGDGSDTITDYTAGDDTIKLASGSISKTELADDGTDVKYTVGSGSITVQNGKSKIISLEDSWGSYTVSGTRIALGKDFKGEMDAGKYLSTVTNIAGSGAVAGVTLRGNANDNVMSGGAQADTLYGVEGSDKLYGYGGNDVLYGQQGNDYLYGGDGADTLYGGSGNDEIYGGGESDILDGYIGNDTLTGGMGNDYLSGGAGSDTFLYSNGDGSDTITDYTAGADKIKIASGSISKAELAPNGTDVKFTIGSGSITVQNGAGKVISLEDSRGSYTVSDTRIVVGKDFKGEMDAGKYLSTLTNIAGSGAAAGVTLRGNANDNVMSGGAQEDTLYGGEGADKLYGYGGNDVLYGQQGNDYLYGGDGADTLYGYGGNDVLYGQQGNDTLTGGTGDDILSGGAGKDMFVYSNGDGSDTIADYTAGEDTIKIASSSISKTELNGNDVTFTVGNGSITVQSGKGKVVSLKDSRGSYTVSDTRIAVGKDFKGEMDAGKYLSTVTNIAGSSATAAVILHGNTNRNVMSGGSQADTMYGGEGSDKLYGYGGNDVLFGQQGNDCLYGGDGADKMYGGSGDDEIYGDAGDDTLDGHTGNDTLTGGAGNDTLLGGSGKDIFVHSNGDGNDTITDFTTSEDTVKIASGFISKTKFADNGKDLTFMVGNGSVTVQNGKGKVISLEDSRGSYTVSDTRIAVGKDFTGEMDASKYLSTVTNIAGSGAVAAVTLRGNVNDNIMSGGTQADTLYGAEGSDKVYGYAGNDVLFGQQGNDCLYGVDGADTLYGGSGNDEIYGGDGNDVLDGYTGNDTLTGGTGNDTLSGGAGKDMFVYSNGDGSDTIMDYAAGEDKIKISSGSINKTEVATNGTDIKFTVGSGSITVQNGEGQVISLEDRRGSYTVSDTRIVVGKDFTGEMDTSKYLPTVTNIAGNGAAAAVTLRGNGNDNVMSGGSQADTLYGGEGSDKLYGYAGNDVLFGQQGNDCLYGGDGADKLHGGSGDDEIYGGDGNDILDGYAGNDTLTGGVGIDALSGGAGKDTFVYSNGDGSDTITDYTAGEDKIKIANGSIDRAELTAYGMDVTFAVGSGSITVQNGKGKVISLEDSRGSYTVSDTRIAVGKDFTGEMDASKYLSTVTNIAGSGAAAAVTLRGNANDNVMSGAAQEDTLYGAEGSDKLYGYAGNDVLFGQQGNDCLYGGDGADTLFGGSGNDEIYGGDESDILDGYIGNDILTGGTGRDTFVYSSGDGNDIITDYMEIEDTIHIKSGAISKATLNGNDVKFTIGSGSILVKNGAGKVINLKDNRGNYTVSRRTIELSSDFSGTMDANKYLSTVKTVDGRRVGNTLTIHGNANANTIYGGEGKNILYGYAGNDILEGNINHDFLYGQDGDDKLHGGPGNDRLTGGSGKDTFIFTTNNGNDEITDFNSEEDILFFAYGFEKATVVNNNKDLRFTLWDNGTVTLVGAASSINDTFNMGKDYHNNETYSLSLSSSTIVLDQNYSGILPKFGEIKTIDGRLTHGESVTLVGNEENNIIYGGSGNDYLYGRVGNDILYGQAGDDKLTGDSGDDTFVYADGDGNDIITDYHYYIDYQYNNGSHIDKLLISSGTISKTTLANKNKDMVFTVGNGTITLTGAATRTISLTDNRGSYTASGTSIVLDSDFGGTLDANCYLTTVKSIDCSKVEKVLEINGNSSGNMIYASKNGGTYHGNSGDDVLYGGNGDDFLYGDEGNDSLYGGDGNDLLYGGDGDDTLQDGIEMYGGSGDDTFIVSFGDSQNSTVFDYGDGADVIEIQAGDSEHYWGYDSEPDYLGHGDWKDNGNYGEYYDQHFLEYSEIDGNDVVLHFKSVNVNTQYETAVVDDGQYYEEFSYEWYSVSASTSTLTLKDAVGKVITYRQDGETYTLSTSAMVSANCSMNSVVADSSPMLAITSYDTSAFGINTATSSFNTDTTYSSLLSANNNSSIFIG